MFRVRRNADPDTYDNGAGGTYQVTALTQASNQQHALAACESFAGSGQCTVGTCGHFTYYYTVTHVHCDGSKGDAYEWIFANTGYSQVGEDYGLGQTDVSGDSLFVRYRPSAGAAWVLALKHLGADTYDNGAGGTYQVMLTQTMPANQQHALAACESFAGSGQCTVGTCGHFTYYYTVTHVHCDGSKGDAYEWIFANTGYSQVGEDYGLGQTDVSGDSLFVRYRPSAGAAWVLALKELGRNCGIRVSSITISCFSV